MNLLIASLFAAPAQAEPGVARRAVVVGINDGGPGLDPLRYAEADARRMADVLVDLGDFTQDEVVLALAPTMDGLTSELMDAVGDLGAHDEALFVFYYSGHADNRGLRLGDELYPYDQLKEDIRAIPADVHLGIVDACRAGELTRLKGAALTSPFLVEEGLEAEGEAWLAASAADEDAQESDRLQGSFFTYYLVSGLRGAADSGEDGWVSLNEAYSYAYDRTVAYTGGTAAGTQHPHYDFQIRGNGDLVLTEVDRATAHITFPAAVEGTITVLALPEARPVAEVAKVAGKPVTLALAPGRYQLRRKEKGALYTSEVGLTEGANHTISRWGDPDALALASTKGVADLPSLNRTGGEARPKADDALTADKIVDGIGDAVGDFDPTTNPPLAAGVSLLMPGTGHMLQGRWVEGALFLGSYWALQGTGWGVPSALDQSQKVSTGSPLGPNALTMMGFMVMGWAASDAAYKASGQVSTWRPVQGVSISAETMWNDTLATPHTSGFSVDYFVKPHVSLGLDRAGFTRYPNGMWDANAGMRLMVGPAWKHVRPGLFLSSGFRAGNGDENGQVARLLFGSGGEIRWYVNPRYFVKYEARWEREAAEDAFIQGGGLGVHLGKSAPRLLD